MADNPVDLDEHRGVAARMETEIRRERFRRLLEEQARNLRHQQELEKHLHAGPAESWQEAAMRGEYLIRHFAKTLQARDAQCKDLIASFLGDLERLRQREKEIS